MTTEIDTPASEIRSLYATACHGDGSAVRNVSRRQLEAISARTGLRFKAFLDQYGLDFGSYIASRPISG